MRTVSRIKSRDELKDYALRALGAPVLQINVDDEQLEDRIDDALNMFWEYHADGAQRVVIKYPLRANDVTNQYLTLDSNILSVLRVLPIHGQGMYSINNLQNVMYMSDIMNIRNFNSTSSGIGGYTTTMAYLGTMDNIFNVENVVGFNMYKNNLSLNLDWNSLVLGNYMMIECYVAVDPEEHAQIWGNRWLREYTTALFKKQWGSNLIKFGSVVLAGGVTLNAEKIFDDGVADVKEQEERLRNEFQLPVDFFVG